MMPLHKPPRIFHRFVRDERGAITVDWVVLSAALIVAVISVFTILTEELYQNATMRIVEEVNAVRQR